MSNAESSPSAAARNPRSVELRVAALLENLAVVRTVIGALATFEDLDLDAVADLKLAVDEACTRLIRSASNDAALLLVVDPRDHELVVKVSTVSTSSASDVLTPGSFSWHVLTSLTDDVQMFNDGADIDAPVVGIALTTRRVSPAR
ncbi:MAG: anti-sigma factor [Mycobacterium sp.]|nr:anti-sigma factor [Mycobacterium sp.]